MIEFMKEFLFHKDSFVQWCRAALLGLGGAQLAGFIPQDYLPRWVGIVALVAGGFLKAGDKNPVIGDDK